jgi:hypothetical protein
MCDSILISFSEGNNFFSISNILVENKSYNSNSIELSSSFWSNVFMKSKTILPVSSFNNQNVSVSVQLNQYIDSNFKDFFLDLNELENFSLPSFNSHLSNNYYLFMFWFKFLKKSINYLNIPISQLSSPSLNDNKNVNELNSLEYIYKMFCNYYYKNENVGSLLLFIMNTCKYKF